jgi:hypothetical protein
LVVGAINISRAPKPMLAIGSAIIKNFIFSRVPVC